MPWYVKLVQAFLHLIHPYAALGGLLRISILQKMLIVAQDRDIVSSASWVPGSGFEC